jgi:Sad1 / UNC-like C-terminal
MTYQQGRVRRRFPVIGILVASVLPLFADENSYEQQESDHSECSKSPSSAFSENERNRMNDCHSKHFMHQSNVQYRLFGEGDAQRFEEVLLHTPTVRNGSTIIPFYPFDFDGFDGASPQPINDIVGPHGDVESVDDSSVSSNTTSNETNSSDDAEDKENVTALAASNETSISDDDSDNTELVAVDYASKSAGALVLDSSPNFQGTSNLLQKDRDKYAIVPCDEAVKYVIIGLSEDILVKQFAIANYERYSSHMKEIRLYGSTSTTAIRSTNKWIDLGTFTTSTNKSYGAQNFFLEEPTWARYLKVEFLSHHGDEFYCTVSQISVHGSTVLQGFHEQWNEDSQDDVDESIASLGMEEMSDDKSPDNGANNIEADSQMNQSSDGNDSNDASEADLVVQSGEDPSRRHPISGAGNCIQISDSKCFHPSSFENMVTHLTSGVGSESVCFDINPSNFIRTLTKRQKLLNISSDTRLRLPISIAGFEVNYSKHQASLMLRPKSKRAETRSNFRAKSGSSYVFGLERVKDILQSTLGSIKDDDLINSMLRPTRVVSDMKKNVLMTTDGKLSQTSLPEIDDRKSDRKYDENVEEIGAMLAKVLTRLPSAKCLESLNFADFKFSSKASGNKAKNGSSSSVSANMEPIFKKLSDEIKSLQSNVAIHDQFAKLSVSCYQRVMLELLLEIESDRRSYDGRISKLENDLQFGSSFVALQRYIRSFLWSTVYWVSWICMMFALQIQNAIVSLASLGHLLLLGLASAGIYTAMMYRRGGFGKRSTSKEAKDKSRRQAGAVLQPSFQYKIQAVSEDEEDSPPTPVKQDVQLGTKNLMRISP